MNDPVPHRRGLAESRRASPQRRRTRRSWGAGCWHARSLDLDVYTFALNNGLVLVTADLGLADPFRYTPRFGTVLVRLPNSTAALEIGRRVAAALAIIADDEFGSSIVVIEPDRVRIRRIGT